LSALKRSRFVILKIWQGLILRGNLLFGLETGSHCTLISSARDFVKRFSTGGTRISERPLQACPKNGSTIQQRPAELSRNSQLKQTSTPFYEAVRNDGWPAKAVCFASRSSGEPRFAKTLDIVHILASCQATVNGLSRQTQGQSLSVLATPAVPHVFGDECG
jgi:hypothetical protein